MHNLGHKTKELRPNFPAIIVKVLVATTISIILLIALAAIQSNRKAEPPVVIFALIFVAVCVTYIFFAVGRLAKTRLQLYEKGIVIHKFLRPAIMVPFSNIAHFTFNATKEYLLFIPAGKNTMIYIAGKNGEMLTKVFSKDYAALEKTFLELEQDLVAQGIIMPGTKHVTKRYSV